ncbi:MAG TPA: FmdB family zinc ribbon protein [Thermoleophilaceae bacterium]|nr:FmdB family zinc ribbon protein [Thermoleophilaceae bacterium]
MPIYEYRCKNGHTLEVMHRMSDDPLASCTTCEAPVQRVFHPVAVHFKGSGFYNTDYGKQAKGSDDGKATGREEGKSKDGADPSQSSSDSSSSSKGDSSSSNHGSSSSSSDSSGAEKAAAKAASESN